MSYLKRLTTIFSVAVILYSCQKEYSYENPSGANSSAQWEFTEGSSHFHGGVDTATVDTISGYKFFTLTGHSSDGGSVISLQVFGVDLKVGTYKTPFSLFTYVTGGTTVYKTDQTSIDSFTVNITKADSTGVTGTFYGKAVNGSTPKKIVDGKFSVAFTHGGTTPSSKDSGNVLLWSKAGCGGGTSTSPIAVTLGNKWSGQITKFVTAEPTTCDPVGSYSVKVPVGTYMWVAKCGTDSVTGTVSVTKGGCTKSQVDFSAPRTTDYFPFTKYSTWTNKYDTANVKPSDTTFMVSTGDKFTAGSQSYNIFIYADYKYLYQDSLFYRKDTAAGLYYEYFPASANWFGFDVPTAVEMPILNSKLSVGGTFSSNVYSGHISSVDTAAITMQIKGSILEKASSATAGNIAYSDVIKVRLSVMATLKSQTTEIYRQEYWFSNHVGIVRDVEYWTAPYTTGTYILNLTRYYIAP